MSNLFPCYDAVFYGHILFFYSTKKKYVKRNFKSIMPKINLNSTKKR